MAACYMIINMSLKKEIHANCLYCDVIQASFETIYGYKKTSIHLANTPMYEGAPWTP